VERSLWKEGSKERRLFSPKSPVLLLLLLLLLLLRENEKEIFILVVLVGNFETE
jgi:hypothetical protein